MTRRNMYALGVGLLTLGTLLGLLAWGADLDAVLLCVRLDRLGIEVTVVRLGEQLPDTVLGVDPGLHERQLA